MDQICYVYKCNCIFTLTSSEKPKISQFTLKFDSNKYKDLLDKCIATVIKSTTQMLLEIAFHNEGYPVELGEYLVVVVNVNAGVNFWKKG